MRGRRTSSSEPGWDFYIDFPKKSIFFFYFPKALLQKALQKFFISGTFDFRIFLKAPEKLNALDPTFQYLNCEFPPALILPVIKDLFHGPFGKQYFFFCRQIQTKAHVSKPSLSPLLSVGCAEEARGVGRRGLRCNS